MILVNNFKTYGWESAVHGMRNPMNSWDKSDSQYDNGEYILGLNDLGLMTRLRNGGSDDRKFMRQLFVSCDITAPLYWWKEMDQYKVATVTNSCSTMHKIAAKAFEKKDFSCEHLNKAAKTNLTGTIAYLNYARSQFIATKDKDWWWQMIQLLPSSYNQMRTWTANYEVLANIYHARHLHKLDEWHKFCDAIAKLPYANELIIGGKE